MKEIKMSVNSGEKGLNMGADLLIPLIIKPAFRIPSDCIGDYLSPFSP